MAFSYQQLRSVVDPYTNVEPENEIPPIQAAWTLPVVSRIPISKLVDMDYNYLGKITTRKALMAKNYALVMKIQEDTNGAIEELYRWLTAVYLPRRFPTKFQLQGFNGTATHIRNFVDGGLYPLEPPPNDFHKLQGIGSLVDEDFAFIFPVVSSDSGETYSQAAYVNCLANYDPVRLASGQKWPQVPNASDDVGNFPRTVKELVSFSDKLKHLKEFDKLDFGRVDLITTWALTEDGRTFGPESHTLAVPKNDVHAEKLYVRCERQTIRRLPISMVIVHTRKTTLYRLATVKGIGLGESLINAIDGLTEANCPSKAEYWRTRMFAERTKAYLRS